MRPVRTDTLDLVRGARLVPRLVPGLVPRLVPRLLPRRAGRASFDRWRRARRDARSGVTTMTKLR